MLSPEPLFRRLATTMLFLLPATATAQDRPWYERVRFAGDFRLRSESFFQEGSPDRSRLRIRLRAGFTAPLSDHLTVGFRLATGNPGNVNSRNATLGEGFALKTFRIDRAYVAWSPSDHFEISGGKIGLPLWRPEALLQSEMLFDEEVTPEGLHERVTLISSEEGTLRRLSVQGEQWVLREVSGGEDSWLVGGQAVLELGLASRATLELAGGYYEYLNGRELAQARNGNSELIVSNSVITESGALVTGGFPLTPSASDPFDRFVSDFRLVHASGGLQVAGVLGRGFAAWVDWIHNNGASQDNDALWVGTSLGEPSGPGDWGIALAWARTEQESVLSFLSYSDFGLGGTNVEGPIIAASWRPLRPLVLELTDHIVTPARAVPGRNSNTLHRLQVDARVSF